MNALYVDGGVIGKNPSEIGGTWAARLVVDGQVTRESSGVITPTEAELLAITNNLTEMLALVEGLEMLPFGWQGTIYSDSMVTLGRAFLGWKWHNVPLWLQREYWQARERLMHWDELTFVLLDGHPTKAQLAAGVGKRGHPVSEHNVWCDHACQQVGERLKLSTATAIHDGHVEE
jgi:ribonuclease HI